MKKGVKCGPGCRGKNCSNSVIAVATAPGTQQVNPTELIEVEEEELLHDSVLRDMERNVFRGVGGMMMGLLIQNMQVLMTKKG